MAKGEALTIMTWDGKIRPAIAITQSPFLDLAELAFADTGEYPVIEISKRAKYPMQGFIAGYNSTDSFQHILPCTIDNQGTTPHARPGGYAMSYICGTQVGMSGGAILDNRHLLIGIHGQSDVYPDILEDQIWRSRLSLGIPITFWLKTQNHGGLDSTHANDFTDTLITAFDFYLRSSYRASIGYLAGALVDAEASVRLDPILAYIGHMVNLQILLRMDDEAISNLSAILRLKPNLWYARILRAKVEFNKTGSKKFLQEMSRALSNSDNKEEKLLGYCWLSEGFAKIGERRLADHFRMIYNKIRLSRTIDHPDAHPSPGNCNEN